jgi:GNAT superfamily N-acetyltransferase
MFVELDNITLEEVKRFIWSLTSDETKYYDIQSDKVLDSLIYIKGIKINGELAGIGGIAKWYYFLPHAFYMVKAQYQGIGIGGKLVDANVVYARNNLSILLNVSDKANIKAVKLVAHRGFKIAGQDKYKNYCYYPLGKLDWFTKLVIKVRTVCYNLF